ncbi:LysR family transcriptional regulator [Saccharopolyspora sp. NFXS83]|uniref:LysR family transcriptional regulator n=1 Tax=Saccharopolyspora sp. NFXS83 TaxID=2993560 RepID=UPI00224A6623|nr:LysR family transcriptional regulator [Saccharopolyspora sp. NFXS83]MCX2729372.1 LysR family transcriptional regulator [Saccharopolyspora sp. NFXS83]
MRWKELEHVLRITVALGAGDYRGRMELRQLDHFLAVARQGSFTGAARETHVVQSALSASIRKLEIALGAQLFERTTRRVLLTEAGRALLPVAQRIAADVVVARGEVSAVAGLSRGRVSVGTIQTLTVVDLPAELGEFRQHHPGVRICVREGIAPELVDAVGAGELDLAYLAGDGKPVADLVGFREWSQRMVLLSHPGHRLADRRRVRLAECDGEPFVEFSGSGLQALIERSCTEAGVRLNRVCEATHIPLLVDLVAAGLGVSIVPDAIAERSGLPHARIEGPSITRPIHLVGRSPEPANPAARALLQHLLG